MIDFINLNDTSAVYTGHVSAKVKRGDKLVELFDNHNTGTIDFLNYLCECIQGSNTSINNRPYYIKLFEDKNCLVPISVYGMGCTETPHIEKQVNSATVTLTFFIPDIIASGRHVQSIALYGKGDQLTPYAKAVTDINSEKATNVNIEVQWTLKFSIVLESE